MRALITGANGQVGWELQRTAPKDVSVLALDRQSLDIRDPVLVDQVVREYKPDVIINAAAYTAVDKAEGERDLAFAINRDGAANIARAANTYGARLIHISTDFVFDGTKSSPYLPDDVPSPINMYGASKLAGELSVREIMGERALILRTAWVYSAHGSNFVRTMLRLMQERDEVRVVCDQLGTPTWANGLARAIWEFSYRPDLQGVFQYTDAGVASWYDLAVAVHELGIQYKLLSSTVRIVPISSNEFPASARRPNSCVLCKAEIWRRLGNGVPRHWRAALAQMLAELRDGDVRCN